MAIGVVEAIRALPLSDSKLAEEFESMCRENNVSLDGLDLAIIAAMQRAFAFGYRRGVMRGCEVTVEQTKNWIDEMKAER